MNNTLSNSFFQSIGTNADSYISRLTKKYFGNVKFFVNQLTKNNFEILNEDGIVIDEFTSDATFRQFINTLLAFGYICEEAGFYRVIAFSLPNEKIFENLLNTKCEKRIRTIRQSRIITLLYELNFINKNNFYNFNFSGKRGMTKFETFIGEISSWEKNVAKNKSDFAKLIKEIEDYDFIKN